MVYSEINEILMSEFPELSTLFGEQFRLWGGTDIPPHCFCGDVLNNYLINLLRENNNSQQIEKIFKFYEKMASSNDENIRNLLQVTLLEYLWDDEVVFKIALEHMLEKTRQINHTIGTYIKVPGCKTKSQGC